jgi:hypothetical protein
MPELGTQGLENIDIITRVLSVRLIKQICHDKKWEPKELYKLLKTHELINIPLEKKSK